MAFRKIIYGEENCPRCNAIAKLRSFPIEESNMVQLRLVCPKCRLSKLIKVTTQKFLDLDAKEKKYLRLLQETSSPSRRNAILNRLDKIRKDKYVAEVQP
jgi:ssDNA-binding Zn-finger/Zn-ribbon topoisomerase 1